MGFCGDWVWLGVMALYGPKLWVAELSRAVSLIPPPLMFMSLGSMVRWSEVWAPDIHDVWVIGRVTGSVSEIRPILENVGNARMVPV